MSHGENNFKSSIFQPIDCMCTLIILLLHKQEMKVEFQVFIFIKSEISSFIQEEFQNLLCHTNTLCQNSIFHFSVFPSFTFFFQFFLNSSFQCFLSHTLQLLLQSFKNGPINKESSHPIQYLASF